MRIRQIKPSFWSDSRLAELPESARLFYIGLWMVADDAGWFRWDPVEVSRDLYGYEGRAKRERRASAMFDALVSAGRVVVHPCGHAEVPKLSDHQHLAGVQKQVRSAFNEHLKECVSRSPANPREDPRNPVETRLGKVRNGKDVVREGTVREGQESARATADALARRDEEDAAEAAMRPPLRAVR